MRLGSLPPPLYAWESEIKVGARATAIAARTSSPVQWNWTEWPVEHRKECNIAHPPMAISSETNAAADSCPKGSGPI